MALNSSFTSTTGTNVGKSVGAGTLVTFDAINLTESTSSAQLIIRANDVDYGLKSSTDVPYAVGNKNSEWDGVYIQKTGSTAWTVVGYLNGTNNNWSYTTFDISSFVSKSGVGAYSVRVVPDDDGTQSQKSNGGSWVVTVPSAEIFLGGDKSISASDLALTSGHVSSLTFKFSEAPVGFAVSDIVMNHGTVRDLRATSDPLVFSAILVPEKGYIGGVDVSIAKAAFTDAAGNASDAATLSGLTVAQHVLSQLDFEVTKTYGTANVALPDGGFWHTDNVGNTIEVGNQGAYGSKASTNHVMELAAKVGDASNFYTQFYAAGTSQLKLSFDYSARQGFDSAFSVYWGGKLVETINPGKTFGVKLLDYTLDVASTGLQSLELRAVNKSSVGAVIDNLSLSATHIAAPESKVSTLSVLDFQNENYGRSSYKSMKMANNSGWFSDNPLGKVEQGREIVYGGSKLANRVIELAAKPGDASNLYTHLLFEQGTHIQFTFDMSARPGAADSRVNVLWGGKVIETIDPGRSFGWQSHSYDLVATGEMQRLEVQAVDHGSMGAVLDNLSLATHSVI